MKQSKRRKENKWKRSRRKRKKRSRDELKRNRKKERRGDVGAPHIVMVVIISMIIAAIST